MVRCPALVRKTLSVKEGGNRGREWRCGSREVHARTTQKKKKKINLARQACVCLTALSLRNEPPWLELRAEGAANAKALAPTRLPMEGVRGQCEQG